MSAKKSFEIANANIDFGTCTLEELNRELKRLSSGKCRLGWIIDKDGNKTELNNLGKQIEKQMQKLTDVKVKRFDGSTSSKWLSLNETEIKELSLDELKKAVASVASRISRYGITDESAKLEQMYKTELSLRKKQQAYEALKAELKQ